MSRKIHYISITIFPPRKHDMLCWADVGVMLSQHRRRRASITPVLVQCIFLTGLWAIPVHINISTIPVFVVYIRKYNTSGLRSTTSRCIADSIYHYTLSQCHYFSDHVKMRIEHLIMLIYILIGLVSLLFNGWAGNLLSSHSSGLAPHSRYRPTGFK